ncbi:hypothetical protein [Hymenobacter norwichensis]|uniref:hypothetical protein n=1 Tax=Hymenobacter norwichensis TaxID=223903 RepID=UPI00146D7667|nr:hypothetical protein [Hymenobacter norwichensis]
MNKIAIFVLLQLTFLLLLMEFSTLATPPLITHTDYLTLNYRPDLQLLVLRWLRDASLSEMQIGHQEALHLARQHAATQWFIDVRRRLLVEHTHTSWVINEFLPQAATLLQAPLRVAYLMSPHRQRTIDSQPELQAIFARAHVPTLPYRMESFMNEAEAIEWLLDK